MTAWKASTPAPTTTCPSPSPWTRWWRECGRCWPVEIRPLDPSHGDLTLHAAASVLCCADERVTLAPAELQIMLLLLRRHEEVVRRSALEAAAWGLSETVTPNALDVALHRIRRKLQAIGSRQCIMNVRGLGYALREDDSAQ
jgi:DNA-binding response OmpR family regulator